MTSGDRAGQRDKSGAWRSRRTWLLWPSLLLGAWAAWSVLSLATSLRAYAIPTGSMSPALNPGDRVGVLTQPRDGPKRGEIWIFRMPPASKLIGSEGVKRVVGLPGETVEVSRGRVLIDGVPLDEPYLAAPMTYAMPRRTLGPNEYFMLGDSRDNSHDSHVWGPLPGDYLVGPVKVRFWPLRRASGF